MIKKLDVMFPRWQHPAMCPDFPIYSNRDEDIMLCCACLISYFVVEIFILYQYCNFCQLKLFVKLVIQSVSCIIFLCRNRNKRKSKVNMLMPKKLNCHSRLSRWNF